MNLLAFEPKYLYDELPYDQFDCVYVLDDGQLRIDNLSEVSVIVITDNAAGLAEDVLETVTDFVEVSDPDSFLASRGIPGDLAIMEWDASDRAYEVLELLCSAGVTVLDGSDEMVQVSLDMEVTIESIIDTITRRVTADVLQQVRAELGTDTPIRRSRFRKDHPRA